MTEYVQLTNIIIVSMMLAILSSLGIGLYCLFVDAGSTKRTLSSLKFRISMSLFLFLGIIFLASMGIISPHGLAA